MSEQLDYENMIHQGEIWKLAELIRKNHELLISSWELSRSDALISKLWEEYPAMARRLLMELLHSDEAEKIVKMLEALSMSFTFRWKGCKCDVNGNPLFRMVWNGEYEVVKSLLDRGADPDGVSRSIYIMSEGQHISPFSRWGKMKCKEDSEDFFVCNRWSDPWGVFERDKDVHIITPLYLAELQGDETMIRILKKAGAHPVPSRENMWENARAPETGGSVFGMM